MHLISHRGNINGKKPHKENNPDYITAALDLGYDVEIDIWYLTGERKYYLGHDEPQYPIEKWFINNSKDKLWLHCKNEDALSYLKDDFDNINFFWHQEDRYTITSKGYVWAFPGEKLVKNSIILFPENYPDDKNKLLLSSGICSDYISDYEIYKNIKKIEHTEQEIILKLKNPVYNFFTHTFNLSTKYETELVLAKEKEHSFFYQGGYDRLLSVVTKFRNFEENHSSYSCVFDDDLIKIENVFVYTFTSRYYHNLVEVFPKLIKLKNIDPNFVFVLVYWYKIDDLHHIHNSNKNKKSDDYFGYLIEFLNLLNIKYKFINQENFNETIFKNSYIFYEKAAPRNISGHDSPYDFLEKNWDKSLSINEYSHPQLFYEVNPFNILSRLLYIRDYFISNLNLKQDNYPKKIFISRKHYTIRKKY